MTEMRKELLREGFGDLGYNDCLKLIKRYKPELGGSGLEPLRIAVLRSYTMDMLKPVLSFRLLLEGYDAEVFIGDYNAYVQEILDSQSRLYSFGADIVVVMVRLEELLPQFVYDYGSKDVKQWEAELKGSTERLAGLADVITSKLGARALFQNAAPPQCMHWGIYDTQIVRGQSELVCWFNALLSERFSGNVNAFIWDFHGLSRSIGYKNLFDAKNWYTAKSPYRQSVYPAIADDMTRYLLSMMKKVKKCIVLDLDNTLWGGIAGEDGPSGIALGPDYPGNCYVDFQWGLKRLYDRGIILAINSKNNEADAMEIIDRHRFMVLRSRHFAAMRINWNDKVSNMKSLACDLNIGLDSMIFIDDSPMECALVRENCPGVEVVQLPDKPYLIPGIVETLPCVENISITEEDRKKGEMYRAQAARKDCERSFNNLDDFLSHLEMEVDIRPADKATLPRIAQLTQKTNQLNMTTRRYTEADIEGFMRSPEWRVAYVSVKDRFGDNGIVGVIILELKEGRCRIDTFLLSCRVIGRKIEQAMLSYIADVAMSDGCRMLIGEYMPTAKNKPAADIYALHGFERRNDNIFIADIDTLNLNCPGYIRLKTESRACSSPFKQTSLMQTDS